MSDVHVIDLAPKLGRERALIGAKEMCETFQPPDWLIPGLLERKQHAVVFGDSGVGKSAVVVDWMLRLACGMPLHGTQAADGEQVGVVYLCNEGRAGVTRRVPAWLQLHGFDTFGMQDIPFAMVDSHLCIDDEGVADLMATLAGFERRWGVPVSLIVIDTLAASFAGDDENDNAAMQRHCNLVAELAQAGPSVIEIHHTGHGNKDRARGASALKGAVDVEMRCWLIVPATKMLIVEATKLKDATGLGRLPYQLVEHSLIGELGDPIGVTAVVAREHELDRDIPPQSMQSWGVLCEMWREQRSTLRQSGRDPDLHPVRVARDDLLSELRELNIVTSRKDAQALKQLYKVVSDLKNAGYLREEAGEYVPLGMDHAVV